MSQIIASMMAVTGVFVSLSAFLLLPVQCVIRQSERKAATRLRD